MASSHSNNRDDIHFEQGSCRIILKQGDLLSENDVDVLVIPTPDLNESNPDTFALYKSVHSNADEDYKREIKRIRSNLKVANPQMIAKNGRGCIFAVPPYMSNPDKARDLLKKTYTSCLNLAVKYNFRKIAFPTIGCGVNGFETTDAARIIYSTLENFGQSKEGNKMDEIRIIVYNNRIWGNFTTEFINLCDSKNAKIKFIDISPKKSIPSEMSLRRDDKRPPERQSQEQTNYTEDWVDDKPGNQRDRSERQTSKLDPESPEYQPKSKNQRRDLRRYHLSNNRTELHILQGDILETKVDAIVNAANEEMLGGSGVDGAIHRAAGSELQRACKAHKQIYRDVRLPTGRSRILLSYNMSKTTYYIINTAGPRYDNLSPEKCQEHLASCYKTSLALANLYDLETIGFTAISCGIFGYPIDEGAEVALKTVDRKADSMKKIFFVLKDDEIYDAWVKKAEKLQFMSLDDNGAAETSTSKQSTTSTNIRKVPENPGANSESNASNEKSERKVIDGSSGERTQNPAAHDHEEPSEKSSNNPNEKFDDQELAETDKGDETKKKKSEKKKSGSEEPKKPSKNPTKQETDQNEEQNPRTQGNPRDPSKSIVAGGFGRGKKK